MEGFMHEEEINIYDENINPIGQLPKKEVHRLGLWHKSIHCWLFLKENGNEYVICQKRSPKKLLMPNVFDVSVAGHYELNEEVKDGFREVQEEFGITVPSEKWHYLGIKFDVSKTPATTNKEFVEVFFAETDSSIDNFKMAPLEVAAVVKIKVEDGLKLFAGEIDSVKAEGVVFDEEQGKNVKQEFVLKAEDFLPRKDKYYAKIFAIADLYFKGYKYLYI